MRLIPAIDLKAGHCVRLLNGDFARETRYDADPEALLAKYLELGADWLHVVDLDGAKDGNLENSAIIRRLAAQKAVNLQVGGGLRTTARSHTPSASPAVAELTRSKFSCESGRSSLQRR